MRGTAPQRRLLAYFKLGALDDGVDLHAIVLASPVGATTAHLFYAVVAGGRERQWITTAYFAPSRREEQASRAAPKRS